MLECSPLSASHKALMVVECFKDAKDRVTLLALSQPGRHALITLIKETWK